MFGASNLKWFDAEYGNLDRFEELVIATDMDGAGETYITKHFERFSGQFFIARFATNDANDFLTSRDYNNAKANDSAGFGSGWT